MSKTYYNFSAPSALSFAVVHGGRRFFVNFSTCTGGVSRYLTDDKKLADKIIAHRWYRQGLITLKVEEEGEQPPTVYSAPAETTSHVVIPAAKSGFTLSSLKAQASYPSGYLEEGEASTVQQVQAVGETDAHPEDKPNYSIDEVSSFTEARQYMIDVLGVTTPIKSREDLLNLCTQYGIEFPNYPL